MSITEVNITTNCDEDYLDVADGYNVTDIITRSVGTDHIDMKHAKKLGINIHNLQSYHINSTAEHYWNLLFRLMRPLNQIPGNELAGKTLLIIGKGKVGKLLAKQAKAFGLRVLTYDIIDGQTKKDLNALLGIAQVIFLCVPLTKKTQNILDVKEFALMKEKPFIVNAARTKLIDLDAAEFAIKRKYIKGYAIDEKVRHRINGYKQENKFVSCEQHMGARTIEAQLKADEEIKLLQEKIQDE